MDKNKMMMSITLVLIYLIMTIGLIVLADIGLKDKTTELETQINQLKFEQEYIEYVKEDNERQREQ